MHEARYWDKLEDDRVKCRLCPHGCSIAPGKLGICGVRKNVDGKLAAMSYGRVTSVAMDPIEKKPLYHFHPGTRILSVGSYGCNFKCDFCQNYTISQGEAPTREVTSEGLAETARSEGSAGIAYTYNEPSIWHEFVYDTARAFREAGMYNVLVTNGYFETEPLAELLEYVDALNIDIKSIEDDFYKRLCGGRLEPVLRSARQAAERAHVEITHLVIPGENDSPEEFERLAEWIADDLGPETPAHLSAYFPRYKRRNPATDFETLRAARETFREKLKYVYVGNVMADGVSDTSCPRCGARLVTRSGYRVKVEGLADGKCAECGAEVDFVT
jgi:pyruvate formate lyase activating enzyme